MEKKFCFCFHRKWDHVDSFQPNMVWWNKTREKSPRTLKQIAGDSLEKTMPKFPKQLFINVRFNLKEVDYKWLKVTVNFKKISKGDMIYRSKYIGMDLIYWYKFKVNFVICIFLFLFKVLCFYSSFKNVMHN